MYHLLILEQLNGQEHAPQPERGRDVLNVPLTGMNTHLLIGSSMLMLKAVDTSAAGARRNASLLLLVAGPAR